jgi:hypothetical protein
VALTMQRRLLLRLSRRPQPWAATRSCRRALASDSSPPLSSAAADEPWPVVIVGAGPCGLTLSALLSNYGALTPPRLEVAAPLSAVAACAAL